MSEPRTALVIDDDSDISDLLRVLLELHGFEVETLNDGIEAVDLERSYDVILLDLKMPIFDGEQLTDYWQLTRPDVLKRVIILSGYSSWAEGRALAIYATVRKPFNLDHLISVVNACVAQ